MAPEKNNEFIESLNTQREFLFGIQLVNISADMRVLNAVKVVRRENFLPAALKPFAYENKAFAFDVDGSQAVVSQPQVVLTMTNVLSASEADHILEVGTGTGYQAAILSHLGAHVTSIESQPQVASFAKANLIANETPDIDLIVGDGTVPLERRTFDRIIVTASMPPDPQMRVLDQLKEGGLAVIPIGGVDGKRKQCDLVTFTRKDDQIYWIDKLPHFEFVLANGTFGWDSFHQNLLSILNMTFYDKIPQLTYD